MKVRFLPAIAMLAILGAAACKRGAGAANEASAAEPGAKAISLLEARKGFVTRLTRQERTSEPAEPPPPELFKLVRYESPAGSLPAYVGVPPADRTARRPAIIWLVGGFSNSISDIAWTPGPADNDQSASAFREAGIVMMYPALRGGNDHAGAKEGFYGEVDDVLAAAAYLGNLDYIDPSRIYLGGHSTGGTLALLAAESTGKFRAIFSFGPADDVTGYGDEVLPFDTSNRSECRLRAPINFLNAITSPTFVFEGNAGRSNVASLRDLARRPHPSVVQFHEIPHATHFSGLQPMTRVIARKILADQGPASNISFAEQDFR